MRQQSFAQVDFERYRKPTRRERFLAQMEQIIPWGELCALIEPYYPKPEGAGRRPVGLERMLRIHFLQHWFGLSDPGVEEALEAHNLAEELFRRVGAYLEAQGLRLSRGTIVDATIIEAPSSTKNRRGQRDPEMGSTRKGTRWDFGLKAHIGVDSRNKRHPSVVVTPAHVHDSQVLGQWLHGGERVVWGDRAYSGKREVIRARAPQARDCTHRKGYRNRPLSEAERQKNRWKSRIRARVEHPLLVMKRLFGLVRVRYRGLAKNRNWIWITCALAGLYMARRRLLQAT